MFLPRILNKIPLCVLSSDFFQKKHPDCIDLLLADNNYPVHLIRHVKTVEKAALNNAYILCRLNCFEGVGHAQALPHTFTSCGETHFY